MDDQAGKRGLLPNLSSRAWDGVPDIWARWHWAGPTPKKPYGPIMNKIWGSLHPATSHSYGLSRPVFLATSAQRLMP
jgi:hypothetical protein